MGDHELRSECAIAATLDIVGDRWSLLVVRDLLFRDDLRYCDLAASTEGMPTNTLADRLRKLTDAGIVEREQYSSRPPRYSYRLTDRGRAMSPILDAMATWGTTYIAGTKRVTT